VYSKLKVYAEGREQGRGPFGVAQGRLFDYAGLSVREDPAALRMTGLRNPGETASFRVTWSAD